MRAREARPDDEVADRNALFDQRVGFSGRRQQLLRIDRSEITGTLRADLEETGRIGACSDVLHRRVDIRGRGADLIR
jgi:hypothetical protein